MLNATNHKTLGLTEKNEEYRLLILLLMTISNICVIVNIKDNDYMCTCTRLNLAR